MEIILWRFFFPCLSITSKKEPAKWEPCQDSSASWWIPSLEAGGISAISPHFLSTSVLFLFIFFFCFSQHIWKQSSSSMTSVWNVWWSSLQSEKADTPQLDLQLGLNNDILYKNLFSCGSFVCSPLGKQVSFSDGVMRKYCDDKCNLETKPSHWRHYPLKVRFESHFS